MKLSNGLKIAAFVLADLLTIFLLFMGLGEMFGGDISGIQHVIPAAVLLALMWLGWKHPYWGGLGLCIAGLLLGVVVTVMNIPMDVKRNFLLIIALPAFLSGALLLTSGLLANPKPHPHA
jgi:hypothetical protein